MESTVHVLVIAGDDALHEEIEAALAEVRGVRGLVRREGDARRGCEVARARRPDLVVLGMDGLAESARSAAIDLAAASPESIVIGAYRPEDLRVDGASVGLLGVLRASVRDFVRRPVSPAELDDVLQRLLLQRRGVGRRAGRIVSFVSNKGGVGKSTLSVNTACHLGRRHPDQVLLVDASVQMGVCASMLDLSPEATLADAARQVDRLDESLLRTLTEPHGSGVRLLAAPRDALEAATVDELALARVLSVARRAFDVVIVDTFPMLDAVAMAVLDLSDRIYVVASAMVPNVLGLEALVGLLGRVGVPAERLSLVLDETHPAFPGRLAARDVADRLGRTIDHVVPFSRRVLTAMNSGRPEVLSASRWRRFARAIDGLAQDVEGLVVTAAVEPSRAAAGSDAS